ncbi:MAG: MipA/OmpV family protein [Pseudomonadota bacterium]
MARRPTASSRAPIITRTFVALALLATALWAGWARAEQKPLWELGLGVGAIVFRDYRGADSSSAYPLPVPYFVYRGKYLQSDRDGLNTRLFNQERVELRLSLNATPPVSQSPTRAGMPKLRPTVEAGPSLDLHLWESAADKVKLAVNLPLRAAFTIERTPHAIGWFFAPHVNVDIEDALGHSDWNLGLQAGPLFANRRYHDYFYSVAPQYATADRPVFTAAGGYSGTQFLAALSKRFPAYWVGGYVRYDTLAGAHFTASPLVKQDSYWMAGVAVTWMIRESDRRVEVDD